MDGWKTVFLLGWPIFRCQLLVSGRVFHYFTEAKLLKQTSHKCFVQKLFFSHKWKNGCISNISYLFKYCHFPLNHEFGRKSKPTQFSWSILLLPLHCWHLFDERVIVAMNFSISEIDVRTFSGHWWPKGFAPWDGQLEVRQAQVYQIKRNTGVKC